MADEACLLPQSFMSGLFRKKGRGMDKKLLSRRDIVFGECAFLRACRRMLAAGPSPSARRRLDLLPMHGFTLFSSDLEGKSGDRMDLLEASPAVRKSFSGNASRQPDHASEDTDTVTMRHVGCVICCRECALLCLMARWALCFRSALHDADRKPDSELPGFSH